MLRRSGSRTNEEYRGRGRKESRKPWPKDCLWPEPLWEGRGYPWEPEDADWFTLDEDGRDLLSIREYYDDLVKSGRLNEDYTLNEKYEDDLADCGEEEEGPEEVDNLDEEDVWLPEMGEDYWYHGFDLMSWEEDFQTHMDSLKIPAVAPEIDPVSHIRETIGYEFINENLMRQAFTRRAFALEYGLSGDNEELELLGDSVLNMVVTRECFRQFGSLETVMPEAPYRMKYDEGELTRIRQQFVAKEHLSERAIELGLDRYILYGTGEEPGESSREDMMEALIGAVAIDSDWNREVLETVVDRLVCLQLSCADEYLKTSYYDLFNAWHQKHFGRVPKYEVDRCAARASSETLQRYDCSIRFLVPENDQDIRTSQRINVTEDSRSRAREMAAELAYRFVVNHGLWMNLREAKLIPSLEDSINQLQEMYQKKYVDEPIYQFEEWDRDQWNCNCVSGGITGFGRGTSKIKAKKRAAYMVLVRLLQSAGICEKEWEEEMYRGMLV